MSNHTRGPWTLNKSGRKIQMLTKVGRKTIAIVMIPEKIGEWNNDPFHANANLIAAAPAMYDALLSIAKGCDDPAKVAGAALAKIARDEAKFRQALTLREKVRP